MNNLKELIIDKNNPLLNHIKWNDLIDSNIQFNDMMTKLLGNGYKGLYDTEKFYDMYDYVWHNSDLNMISDTYDYYPYSIKYLKNTIPLSYNSIIGIDENEKLIKIVNNASTQLSSYPVDDFAYNHNNKYIVAKYKNRLYKISDKETTGLNLLFDTDIKAMALDNFYLYLLTEDRIIYGEINSIDNTYYEEIELKNKYVSLGLNDTHIILLEDTKKLCFIDKKTAMALVYPLTDMIKNISKAKIVVPNNKYVLVYDGEKSIYSFYFNESEMSQNHAVFTIPTNSIENFRYNNGFYALSNLEVTNIYSNLLQPLTKVDIKKVITENTFIKSEYLFCGLDLTQNQFRDKELKIRNKSNIENQLNYGIKFKEDSNSQIVLQTPLLSFATVMFDIKKFYYKENCKITIDYNLKKNIFELEKNNSDDYKIFAQISENDVKWFVYNERNKLINIKNSIIEESNTSNMITIEGKSFELNSIVIFKEHQLETLLPKYELDFIVKNNLILDTNIFETSTPCATVKTDYQGNANIQSGTNDTKGILRIADDVNAPAKDKAFSTIGANEHSEAIIKLNKIINEDVSHVNHTHKFNEILEVPNATIDTPGIVKLNNDISNKSDEAATPLAVQKAYDKANHEHPFLHIKNGGTVVGPTVFYEASFNKLSANGEIKINKIGGINTIVFQDDANNGGYIKHKQETSKGIIYFSSGTIRDNINGFSFGYSVANKYQETAFLSSSGILTVNSLNTKNVVISGYTVTIG